MINYIKYKKIYQSVEYIDTIKKTKTIPIKTSVKKKPIKIPIYQDYQFRETTNTIKTVKRLKKSEFNYGSNGETFIGHYRNKLFTIENKNSLNCDFKYTSNKIAFDLMEDIYAYDLKTVKIPGKLVNTKKIIGYNTIDNNEYEEIIKYKTITLPS